MLFLKMEAKLQQSYRGLAHHLAREHFTNTTTTGSDAHFPATPRAIGSQLVGRTPNLTFNTHACIRQPWAADGQRAGSGRAADGRPGGRRHPGRTHKQRSSLRAAAVGTSVGPTARDAPQTPRRSWKRYLQPLFWYSLVLCLVIAAAYGRTLGSQRDAKGALRICPTEQDINIL